ncbi:MAG TPA: DUF6515 family protein [Gammaproteobacteria bacterium]|nr:DUF6515 family protein [Gammaproteobacteria bacterium]
MAISRNRRAAVGTALASGVITAVVALAPPLATAQPPVRHENQQRERPKGQQQRPGVQRQHQQVQRQPQRAQRQHTDRNRYEWRRNRYIVARPLAAPIKTLPKSHVTVRIGDRHYYEHRGHYYVHRPSGFVLVAPPIGVVVATLPVGAVSVHIGGVVYFLAGGVYYRHAPTGYVVVTAPQPAPDMVDTSAQRVVVQAAILNVRSGPGLEFSIVARAEQGVSMPVFGSTPGWYYVRLPDGLYGWVMAEYTIPVHVGPEG